MTLISSSARRTRSRGAPGGAPSLSDDVVSIQEGTGDAPLVSLVIPTRHERDNVAPLVSRLATALAGRSAEIVFVDDSDDDTPEAIRACISEKSLTIRMIHRDPGERAGGLGTAVVAGMAISRGTWVVVMDADLQHPPELVPHLLEAAVRGEDDLVVASRFLGGGSAQGLDGTRRHLASRAASGAAKVVFPRRVARLSDPMSGFFLVRRSAVDVHRLRPDGYKILLEVVVRQPGLRLAEVTFQFADRSAGESKMSARTMVAYVRHLARLRLGIARERDHATDVGLRLRSLRFLLFGLVGLSGIAVNVAALWALHLHALHLHYLIAATLATQVSTLWNFVLTDTAVFHGPKPGRRSGRLLRFAAMNNLALLARLPLLALLVHLAIPVLWANTITLVLLFLVRFHVSDRVIYQTPVTGAPEEHVAPQPLPVNQVVDLVADPAAVDRAKSGRVRYLPYRYDVGGIVTLGSQVPLPELEYFRAQWLDVAPDIAIRVGDVGRTAPRVRAAMTQLGPAAVRYEEHLGRLGANFRIDLGDSIAVTVGPLLAHSPHVVYTNIIEALLRFVVASRGRMLLHSACLELNGRGVMLSARTDTGKTATVLRLLREQGGQFLSDDMTIIDPQANALCFPKPLTISHHTLRAINAGDLTPREWRRLGIQSRLHSKSGRGLALVLSRSNVPIMAINAVTQMVVPPPKYNADRLVPCRIGGATTVKDLFIIQRGAPETRPLAVGDVVDELMLNTADAYGFPPFQYFAPALVLGGEDYVELQRRERELLGSAMQHVNATSIASDVFGWADVIPRMLAERYGDAPVAAPSPLHAQPGAGGLAGVQQQPLRPPVGMPTAAFSLEETPVETGADQGPRFGLTT